MHILFLTHRLPYAPNRGDRLRALQILRHLAGRHEVTLVSLAHDADEAAHAGDLLPLTGATIAAPVPYWPNRLRAALALAGTRPLTHALLSSPAVRPALERVVRERPPDVVLAYCSSMARYALEPPLDRFPLVIDMVDADSAKWAALARASRPPLSWIYRREACCLTRFEALAMRRAVATAVVNEREREALVGVLARTVRPSTSSGRTGPRGSGRTGTPDWLGSPFGDARIVVLPNGIDVGSFAPPGPPSGLPGVVFCGVMDYAPNVAGAIWLAREVWPLVRAAEPRATLGLVGARPTRAVRALQSTAQGIAITGAVEDVRPFLWNAAVSAAPLHTARGVQNKVLEAVAAGLPTVVTQAVWEGLPPAVQPACRVANTPREFADAILALLRMQPAERRALAQSADLSSLSWEACLAPLEGILREAAATGRA